jgi:hypothetical protein
MVPSPPAFETAEARGAVDVWAMPARRIGWVMERRFVRGVVIVGRGGEAILGGEEGGRGGGKVEEGL